MNLDYGVNTASNEMAEATDPVSSVDASSRMVSKVLNEYVPLTMPPATLQSFVSNFCPLGAVVQRIGIIPIASEIARTRSSRI